MGTLDPNSFTNALNGSAHSPESGLSRNCTITINYEISADLHHVPYRAVKAFLAPGQLNGSDHRTRADRQPFAQPKGAIRAPVHIR